MSNPLRPELLHPCPGARPAAGLQWAGAALVRGILMMVLVAGSAYGGPATAQGSSAPRSRLHFVLQAGDASYLVLATLGVGEKLPPHGVLRMVGNESAPVVIAEVAEAELPEALRPWRKREVVVDERCRETVAGFAIVSRLFGQPGYAGLTSPEWTADSVLSAGHKVLVARLTRCKGSFARAADTVAISVPRPVVNEAAVAAARADFLASETVIQAKKAQVEAGFEDGERVATPRVVAVRHPTTGETWISLHLRSGSGACDDTQLNLWGLYRVTRQGVERKQLIPLESLQTIDTLLDIDGDGRLELLTTGFFGLDRELRSGDGKVLDHLTMPIYDCLC
ncbi:hypothetical protein ACN28E_51205 [Archangium lansingense]|uniref:hypothetical protein n=1 Tax=Archangium lansingense TaxID=2995310 RepID=UPI003B7BCE5E